MTNRQVVQHNKKKWPQARQAVVQVVKCSINIYYVVPQSNKYITCVLPYHKIVFIRMFYYHLEKKIV